MTVVRGRPSGLPGSPYPWSSTPRTTVTLKCGSEWVPSIRYGAFMKKIVPDPPHTFDLPAGKSLSRAISEGIVPMEFVLMNVSYYLMFAYSDSRRALERIEDEEARQQLEHGLRAMQIAWGQADALALAVERHR